MRAARQESQYGMREGRNLELSLLGEADVNNPNYKKALLDRIQIRESGRYVTFKDALELAKKFQPGDPTNPSKDFLRELRLAVIDRLAIEPGQENNVKVYTAVETPLDKLHGVDGFVTVQIGDQKEILVTLDVTANPEKMMRGAKAQIIIGEPANPQEDEGQYLMQIDMYAVEIVARIKDELKLRRPHQKFPPAEEAAQMV